MPRGALTREDVHQYAIPYLAAKVYRGDIKSEQALQAVETIMAINLKTLDGIAEAREDLYGKLVLGEIPEVRAREAERMLRGQQILKGDMRLKFLSMIMGNKKFEPFAADLAQSIATFVNGPAALGDGK